MINPVSVLELLKKDGWMSIGDVSQHPYCSRRNFRCEGVGGDSATSTIIVAENGLHFASQLVFPGMGVQTKGTSMFQKRLIDCVRLLNESCSDFIFSGTWYFDSEDGSLVHAYPWLIGDKLWGSLSEEDLYAQCGDVTKEIESICAVVAPVVATFIQGHVSPQIFISQLCERMELLGGVGGEA